MISEALGILKGDHMCGAESRDFPRMVFQRSSWYLETAREKSELWEWEKERRRKKRDPTVLVPPTHLLCSLILTACVWPSLGNSCSWGFWIGGACHQWLMLHLLKARTYFYISPFMSFCTVCHPCQVSGGHSSIGNQRVGPERNLWDGVTLPFEETGAQREEVVRTQTPASCPAPWRPCERVALWAGSLLPVVAVFAPSIWILGNEYGRASAVLFFLS